MKATDAEGWADPVLFQRHLDEQKHLNGSATTAPETATRGPPRTEAAVSLAHRRAPLSGSYTQVPNVAFELPARLGFDASVFSVLIQICRLTYGMQSPDLSTSIGLRKLAERSGLSKSSVATALTTLERLKLIERDRRTDAAGRQASTTIHITLPDA